MNLKLPKFNRWKDPDYQVRLDYAQRSKNQGKLLYLAINDVHEDVRIAAVKNLKYDDDLLAVIQESGCDRAVALAVGMADSDEVLSAAVRIADLPASLRLDALERISDPEEALYLELVLDRTEKIALHAIASCRGGEALEALYSEDLSEGRALAIIERSDNQAFAIAVFENSAVLSRRVAALRKISDQAKLCAIYLDEHDSGVRALVIEQCHDDQALIEFFDDEDDESLRVKIAAQVSDDSWLFDLACEDYNINVRRSAAHAIRDTRLLVRVAVRNEDRSIHNVVLGKPLSDADLFELSVQSKSAYLRIEAVQRINDQGLLERLVGEAMPPDLIWFASRRLGLLPIDTLRQISSSEVLVKAAEQESVKIARIAAIREVREDWALQKMANSSDSSLAEIARALAKEEKTPTGISFLPVPNRDYQLSVFPVTGEQFAYWKAEVGDQEGEEKYLRLKDRPVTDVSYAEAMAFCDWLSRVDNARYRLPYFHEWKHAAVCDDPEWFSTGRLRAFANKEEVELVLFGKEHSARSLHEAIPNPWGFLDMIGNVLEWTCETPFSSQMIKASLSVDELARHELVDVENPNVEDYAYASGNHWGDRRIRAGRWKRLIHQHNVTGEGAGKIGFRVLRVPNQSNSKPIDYELKLLPDVAFGYTLEQVCWGLSQSLTISFEDAQKHFAVAPYRLAVSRDYAAVLRIKEGWEAVGALTELTSRPA